MIVRSQRTGTNQVIDIARQHLNMPPWSPQQDQHVFNAANPGHTFHSAFMMAPGRQYAVMPYVFGGSDSRTRFLTRINNRTCPGGWDRISGNTTSHWYHNPPDGLGYGARVPGNLGGIDCSAYVSTCWQIARHTTRTLPNVCLQIDRSSLKAGDILNRRGRHVRIFNSWVGRQINVYEATGGSAHREFRTGDEFGCVVHHTIAWDEHYTPYSPFPQFEAIEPATCPVLGTRPAFRIRVKGSGNLELSEFTFDGTCVLPKTIKNPSKRTMDVTYTPNYDLNPGEYVLLIEATNTIAGQTFKDELTWRFQVA